eukprot:s3956_g1.t1
MTTLDELQQFIDVNGLSPNVADLLHAAPVLVQRSVLDQGSLATCRDPNAGCVGRIRKAERRDRSVAPVGFVAPSRDDPWLKSAMLMMLGDRMRGAPPAVQWHVLEQGSLRSCREPSAGCIGRISKAKRNMDPALLAIPQGPSAFEVEEFIQEERIKKLEELLMQQSLQNQKLQSLLDSQLSQPPPVQVVETATLTARVEPYVLSAPLGKSGGPPGGGGGGNGDGGGGGGDTPPPSPSIAPEPSKPNKGKKKAPGGGDGGGDDGDDPGKDSDDSDEKFVRRMRKFLGGGFNMGNSDDKPKVKEADTIKLPAIPGPETYRNWRIKTREAIVAASTNPDTAFEWIGEVWKEGQTIEALRKVAPFATLDAKLLSALTNIITGDFARKVDTFKETEAND